MKSDVDFGRLFTTSLSVRHDFDFSSEFSIELSKLSFEEDNLLVKGKPFPLKDC
jgi:hypothetical protein